MSNASPKAGLSPDAVRFTGEVKLGRIMVGTPMYGGLCHDAYLHGMMSATRGFSDRGIQLGVITLRNESLIQRARNKIAAAFLASDASHLVFIDADIGFTGESLLRLLAHDRPIMAGVYRKKTLDSVDFAMNMIPTDDGRGECDPKTGAVRMLHVATGFLAIKREVIQAMYDARPDLHYRLHEGEDGPGAWRDLCHLWFDCFIDPVTRAYVSEDYGFCMRAAELGFESWMDPGIILEHHGTACFVADPTSVFRIAPPV